MTLYSVPSQFSEKIIEINDYFIHKAFKSMSGHYTCVAGYDFETGEFRSNNYREAVLAISGIDLSGIVTPKDSRTIHNKLSEIIADVKTHKWLKYYYHKHPRNLINFPIEIHNHCEQVDDRNISISSCELEFLQTLFQVYGEYQLYLIPVTK